MTASQERSRAEKVSKRELDVLRLVAKGLSNHEIAQDLHLSIETVKWYNKQLFRKLGVKNRVQAANKAVDLDILGPEPTPRTEEKPHSQGNFPAPLTSFIGREKEIREIKGLLRNHRLVVLTGAGGSGKTRLALTVGESMRNEFRDGVWFVELANVREPSLVMQAIAEALKVSENTGSSAKNSLKNYLRRRHLLLLLDNFEHLLACSPMVGDLLAAAPQLSVIGTSRERLNIYGEQEYLLKPLDLPHLLSKRSIEEFKNVESVALFIERASAVLPDFSPNEKEVEDLTRICIGLDGLPLAIELCAPMVKMFSLKMIADRIEKSLDAIPGGPHDLPARQQSLHGTIQWSYDLLEEEEKRLFVRLAVFNGGGTLQAITAICGDGLAGQIEKILSALVNKNLVVAQERQDGEIHFILMETIRQFGLEMLLASQEADLIADRHIRYFLSLAKAGSVELRGPNQIIWMDRLIASQDNMRAALETAIQKGDAETALDLVSSSYQFWLRHSDFEEGRLWIERAMGLTDAKSFLDKYSEAFNNLSWLSWLQDNNNLDAWIMAEQALGLAQSESNKQNTATALLNLGMILMHQKKDFAKSHACLEQAKELYLEIHDQWGMARALMDLAIVELQNREFNSARSLYHQSLSLFQELGDIGFQCLVTRLIGDLEIRQDNMVEGAQSYRDSLKIALVVKNNAQIAYNFRGLARVEKARGRHARAVRLYLASKRILEDIGVWSRRDERELDDELSTARTILGLERFRSEQDASFNMTLEDAIQFAQGSPGT